MVNTRSIKLTLVLFLFFLSFPLPAWAYFDPGFGGYLANSIISLIVTALAFVSASVVYFFRTIIGQKLVLLWQKNKKFHNMIFLFTLGLACIFFGTLLFSSFSRLSAIHSHLLGTKIIDSQHMCQGYNLYNGKLIDEEGRIVKKWGHDYLGIIDNNGDYFAQEHWRAPLWGRYTWNDKIIWEKHFPIHHELYLSPTGTIFTFTRKIHHYNNYKVNFDIILEFDKNGNQLQRYSFWDHLKEFQPYHNKFQIDAAAPIIFQPIMSLWQETFHGEAYDYFHINSFFIIPPNPLEGKNPAFRPGNWLINIFHGSMVFILDQDSKRILWHAVANEIEGSLEGQHSASMLPDGNILIFDNGVNRGSSRILMIDPLTLKIKWQYTNKNFFSESEGFVQALPNGDFLVTESKKGHAFELTPDKRIVWDYYDTTTNGDGEIYRMTRYPKEMIDRFLRKDITK